MEPLPDLSNVITMRDIETHYGCLPHGSIGTIVSVYVEHGAYLVEFAAPWEVQQISHADVRPISDDELAVRLIDWSDCSLVQCRREYLGGALAMKSSPRMPVEALIVNYESGYSVEEIAAMYAGPLNVDEVRQIIRHYMDKKHDR